MTENSTLQNMISPKQVRNAFRLVLVTAISAGLASIYYFSSMSGVSISFFAPSVQLGLISITGFFSTFLIYKGRVKTAVTLVLSVTSLALVIMAIRTGGLDIMMAALIITITFGISSLSLPKKEAQKAIYGSFIVALFFLFLYFFEPFERYSLEASNTTTWIVTGSFLFAFLALILGQFRTYALRTKLILAFVFLSTIGVSIAFTFANFDTRQTLEDNAEQRLLAGATSSASNVDAFLRYSIDSVVTASAYLDMRAYFLLSPENRRGTQIERQVLNLLYTLNNRNPDIVSYGLLDLDGINIADSDTKNIGHNEADQDYFSLALNARKTYISPVLYLPGEDNAALFFSAPIYNDMGAILGVVRAHYRASVLQDLLANEEHLAGEGSFSILFDNNHIVLAHGLNEDLVGKISFPLSIDELEKLKQKNLFPSTSPVDGLSLNFKAIEDGLNGFASTPYFSGSDTTLGIPISGAVTQLKSVPWLIVSAQPQEIFFAPVERQARRALIAAIAVIIFAALSGIGLANVLAAPIIRLQAVAQKFTEGDLTVTAPIEAEDEIGKLALTFNTLTAELGEVVDTLEHRIAERTKDLETRTNYLEGSAEVSRTIGSILDPDTLITQVVELIKERFDLYYVGLFLVDAANEWCVLKAGSGEAGQKMMGREHQIKVGEGMIGWCIENGKARIALDVGADAVRFENPDLPETRTEGALPLRSRGRVIGALTVQSTEEAAFDDTIITALQTMVDQIAVALDNAELFVQAEAAFESERKAYGQLSQQSWQALSRSKVISRFTVKEDGTVGSGGNFQTTVDLAQIGTGEHLLQDDGLTAIIPIRSRNHVLGGIKVRKSAASSAWTKDQLEITQTISDQLSVALESARLLEDAQRRAAKERIITEGTTRISAALDVESILRATAEELERALGSSEVLIQFESED